MPTPNQPIQYFTKNKYGTFYKYPTDPQISQALHLLTSRTTLSDNHIRAFELLGFTFVEIPDPQTSQPE